MQKHIVCTGDKYSDIDGFACAIAYAEALRLKGVDAGALLSAPVNYSVPRFLLKLDPVYKYKATPEDYLKSNKYIIVDTQDISSFPDYVKIEQIAELYDHRWGTEEYWKAKLHDNAVIEPVGACATLIWEKIKTMKVSQNISDTNLKLLAAAIASNTLNFQAKITSERDKIAFAEISELVNLPNSWIENYFAQVQQEVIKNLEIALKLDIKTIKLRDGSKVNMGQLELWDGLNLLRNKQSEIFTFFQSLGIKWVLTAPCIKDGINVIFTKDQSLQEILEDTLSISFSGYIATTSRIILRKEILKKLSDNNLIII